MRRSAIWFVTMLTVVITALLAGAMQPRAYAQGDGPAANDPSAGDAAAADLGPEEAIQQKIGVWRIEALGIDDELVARLDTLFRMELDRLAATPLPSRRTADLAAGKDLGDCTGEESCLTRIGKRLSVDVMVTGNVAALGDSYLLNIKAVDVKTGKLLRDKLNT